MLYSATSLVTVAGFNVNSLTGSKGFKLLSLRANDMAGRYVDSVGDLNGDGLADIVIGAPGADSAATINLGEGRAYVVLGSTSAGALDGRYVVASNNRCTNIESIDMRGAGSNTLSLGVQDLLDLSDSTDNLFVRGDAAGVDSVDVAGPGFTRAATKLVGGVTHADYTVAGYNMHLYVEQNVTSYTVRALRVSHSQSLAGFNRAPRKLSGALPALSCVPIGCSNQSGAEVVGHIIVSRPQSTTAKLSNFHPKRDGN